MERNRSRKQKEAPEKLPYTGRLVLRIFLSVMLILVAIFIKQNSPDAVKCGREVLSEWTVAVPLP